MVLLYQFGGPFSSKDTIFFQFFENNNLLKLLYTVIVVKDVFLTSCLI
jgi:hypothetical protein